MTDFRAPACQENERREGNEGEDDKGSLFVWFATTANVVVRRMHPKAARNYHVKVVRRMYDSSLVGCS